MELKPETERLVIEQINRGHVLSVDELIVKGVEAIREESKMAEAEAKPRKSLVQLLTQYPFAGSEPDLERVKEFPRPIDL